MLLPAVNTTYRLQAALLNTVHLQGTDMQAHAAGAVNMEAALRLRVRADRQDCLDQVSPHTGPPEAVPQPPLQRCRAIRMPTRCTDATGECC
jgi:hypothetical protein